MSDVALIAQNGDFSSDIAVSAGDLVADGGMDTAIILSLFCDARADEDDVLPFPGADRRGWWGDAYAAVPGDVVGSKLWLLSRSGASQQTATRAQQYAEDALAWMVTDGVVASFPGPQGWIALSIDIARPTGPGRLQYDYVWKFA
jgi:phage gp46-like protein